MKILVTENQLSKILREEDILLKVIKEQLQVASDSNQLTILQQKINDLISDKNKEKAIFDGVTIKLLPGKPGYKLQIGKRVYPMEKTSPNTYAYIVPSGKNVTPSWIKMSSLMPEIEKLPEYKSLVEKHPEIKSQIQKGVIYATIYADKVNQGFFRLERTKTLPDRKEMKYAIPVQNGYPFGEFFERNKVNFKFPDGTFGILESGYLMKDLTASDITIDAPPQQQNTVTAPVQVKPMALGDSFNFNDVEFKDVNATNQQLQAFIQQIKGFIESYGTPFIEQFKAQNPTIYGYSSMDGDPNQKLSGDAVAELYKPCSGSGTRSEYDKCLSHQRAKKIAEILNKELPELGNAFQYVGVGETTKWGPGWTPQRPTHPDATAANRRYVLSPGGAEGQPLRPFAVSPQPKQPMAAAAQTTVQ